MALVSSTRLTADERQFLESFENCTLPEEKWTHAAHVKVAWLYLGHLSRREALDRIRSGILRYNTEVLDRRIEYHETITVAFTRIIADRLESTETWPQFESNNADLFGRGMAVLLRFYSEERLMADEARQRFVEPDIKDLPKFV